MPSTEVDHEISTPPWDDDSAPYFNAFVASSLTASVSDTACLGATFSSAPETLNFPSPARSSQCFFDDIADWRAGPIRLLRDVVSFGERHDAGGVNLQRRGVCLAAECLVRDRKHHRKGVLGAMFQFFRQEAFAFRRLPLLADVS